MVRMVLVGAVLVAATVSGAAVLVGWRSPPSML